MNVVIIRGNLTRDPEVRVVGKGSTVVNFTVAVSRYFTRRDGTKDKDVVYVACEAWDTGAEYIGENFTKGDPILLEGYLKEERWEKDGVKNSRTKVRVNQFEKLNRGTGTRAESNETEETKEDLGIDVEGAPF